MKNTQHSRDLLDSVLIDCTNVILTAADAAFKEKEIENKVSFIQHAIVNLTGNVTLHLTRKDKGVAPLQTNANAVLDVLREWFDMAIDAKNKEGMQ